MTFNMLVTTCLHPKTRYKDKNDSNSPEIKIGAEGEERIAFFVIDDADNPESKFRVFFGASGTEEKICDLLIYYHNPETNRKDLILTEAKGKDFSSAAKQLVNTFQKISQSQTYKNHECCKDITIRLCCVSKRISKSTYSNAERAKKEILTVAIGVKKGDCAFVQPNDFERFIRGQKVGV